MYQCDHQGCEEERVRPSVRYCEVHLQAMIEEREGEALPPLTDEQKARLDAALFPLCDVPWCENERVNGSIYCSACALDLSRGLNVRCAVCGNDWSDRHAHCSTPGCVELAMKDSSQCLYHEYRTAVRYAYEMQEAWRVPALHVLYWLRRAGRWCDRALIWLGVWRVPYTHD